MSNKNELVMESYLNAFERGTRQIINKPLLTESAHKKCYLIVTRHDIDDYDKDTVVAKWDSKDEAEEDLADTWNGDNHNFSILMGLFLANGEIDRKDPHNAQLLKYHGI